MEFRRSNNRVLRSCEDGPPAVFRSISIHDMFRYLHLTRYDNFIRHRAEIHKVFTGCVCQAAALPSAAA